MSGGLYCIRARPGNGKSYVATAIAIAFMLIGRKVFTNYPIVYNNGFRVLESRALEKEMLLNENLNGSVIIIDEAWQWFWSRNFKGFTDEWTQFFSTLSQKEISLYYIVQSEDRIDTIVNDCANLFAEVEKTEIPVLEMPVCFTVSWYCEEIEMQLARTKQNVDPYHVERFWFDRYIAQAFDTKFFGSDKREPFEGEVWTSYLKRTKNFDYQGNYDFTIPTRCKIYLYNRIWLRSKVLLSDLAKRIVSPRVGTEGADLSQLKDLSSSSDQNVIDEELFEK